MDGIKNQQQGEVLLRVLKERLYGPWGKKDSYDADLTPQELKLMHSFYKQVKLKVRFIQEFNRQYNRAIAPQIDGNEKPGRLVYQGTVSGRIQSNQPNMSNIPKSHPLGKDVTLSDSLYTYTDIHEGQMKSGMGKTEQEAWDNLQKQIVNPDAQAYVEGLLQKQIKQENESQK